MPRTIHRALLTVATVGALALPAGATGATQDLRSPDSRDAQHAVVAGASQDLRSPDTRDVALARVPVATPAPAAPDVTSTEPGGFDWASAGVGAGVLALASLLVAGLVGRVRHGRLAV